MSYTCPTCNITSHHPKDEEFKYCGNCNQFEQMRELDALKKYTNGFRELSREYEKKDRIFFLNLFLVWPVLRRMEKLNKEFEKWRQRHERGT